MQLDLNSKTFHLSHIDLDGYASQVITSKKFKKIHMHQTNYGKVIADLSIIVDLITKGDNLLITDVNLSETEAAYVQTMFVEKGINVLLLDHHEKGRAISEKYDWYNLDVSICATKMVYNYFEVEYDNPAFSDMVNAYDMYQEESPLFSKAQVLNNILWENKNMFPEDGLKKRYENGYLLYIIEETFLLLNEPGIISSEVEAKIYFIQRKFFTSTIDEPDTPLFKLKINWMYDKILNNPDTHIYVIYKGFAGAVFYGMNSIFQEFSHKLLNENNINIKFVMHIGTGGRVSVRSIRGEEEVNTNIMCRDLFNGGGHQPASGGVIFEPKLKLDRAESFTLARSVFDEVK